jgi:hypothetical protein
LYVVRKRTSDRWHKSFSDLDASFDNTYTHLHASLIGVVHRKGRQEGGVCRYWREGASQTRGRAQSPRSPKLEDRLGMLLYLLTVFHVPGTLTYINFVSVKLFIRVQNVFTVSKLAACLIIVISGIYMLCVGKCWLRTPGLPVECSLSGSVTNVERCTQNGTSLFQIRV